QRQLLDIKRVEPVPAEMRRVDRPAREKRLFHPRDEREHDFRQGLGDAALAYIVQRLLDAIAVRTGALALHDQQLDRIEFRELALLKQLVEGVRLGALIDDGADAKSRSVHAAPPARVGLNSLPYLGTQQQRTAIAPGT